jgi:hypothetical protein
LLKTLLSSPAHNFKKKAIPIESARVAFLKSHFEQCWDDEGPTRATKLLENPLDFRLKTSVCSTAGKALDRPAQ